jgi:hypothetical protein
MKRAEHVDVSVNPVGPNLSHQSLPRIIKFLCRHFATLVSEAGLEMSLLQSNRTFRYDAPRACSSGPKKKCLDNNRTATIDGIVVSNVYAQITSNLQARVTIRLSKSGPYYGLRM